MLVGLTLWTLGCVYLISLTSSTELICASLWHSIIRWTCGDQFSFPYEHFGMFLFVCVPQTHEWVEEGMHRQEPCWFWASGLKSVWTCPVWKTQPLVLVWMRLFHWSRCTKLLQKTVQQRKVMWWVKMLRWLIYICNEHSWLCPCGFSLSLFVHISPTLQLLHLFWSCFSCHRFRLQQ